MVSTWRFWSGKEINLAQRHPFQLLFLISIVLYASVRYSQVVLFFAALAYMFSGIWARAAYSWSRRRRRPGTEPPAVQGSSARGTRSSHPLVVNPREQKETQCTRLL